MCDLSFLPRLQFSFPGKSSEMEDAMLSGLQCRRKHDRRLLKWNFKALVECSLKRYTSELGPAKFLVLLLVKYYLDGSFGHGIFRWANLDVKWSIESLRCKVNCCNNISGIPVVYFGSIVLILFNVL